VTLRHVNGYFVSLRIGDVVWSAQACALPTSKVRSQF